MCLCVVTVDLLTLAQTFYQYQYSCWNPMQTTNNSGCISDLKKNANNFTRRMEKMREQFNTSNLLYTDNRHFDHSEINSFRSRFHHMYLDFCYFALFYFTRLFCVHWLSFNDPYSKIWGPLVSKIILNSLQLCFIHIVIR